MPAPGPTAVPSSTRAQIDTPDRQTPLPVVVTPPGSMIEEMQRLCIENLSKRLNISADQIVMVKVTPVIWKDASLGCPKPGIDYVRVETPGYSITLQAGGEIYTYHTNQSNRAVLCNPK
jgi:hypothetical protein